MKRKRRVKGDSDFEKRIEDAFRDFGKKWDEAGGGPLFDLSSLPESPDEDEVSVGSKGRESIGWEGSILGAPLGKRLTQAGLSSRISSRAIKSGIFLVVVFHSTRRLMPKYSWMTTFRSPRIERQGISGAMALISSGTCEAASPMIVS